MGGAVNFSGPLGVGGVGVIAYRSMSSDPWAAYQGNLPDQEFDAMTQPQTAISFR